MFLLIDKLVNRVIYRLEFTLPSKICTKPKLKFF